VDVDCAEWNDRVLELELRRDGECHDVGFGVASEAGTGLTRSGRVFCAAAFDGIVVVFYISNLLDSTMMSSDLADDEAPRLLAHNR
jgi:hypothetical protein